MTANESNIDLVRQLAMALPGVEESTIHGAPSWKLGGKLLTCPAIHSSADPNSLVVKTPSAERDELLATQPDAFYVTDHYRSGSVVLVRLSMIDRESLQALLKKAWHFVGNSKSAGP